MSIRCSSVRDSAAHGNELDYDRAGSVSRLLARLLKSDGAIGAYNAAISQAEISASAATMDVCHAMCARTALGSALTHTHAHSGGSSSMCRLRLAAERLDQPQLAHAPTLEALLRASQAREHRLSRFTAPVVAGRDWRRRPGVCRLSWPMCAVCTRCGARVPACSSHCCTALAMRRCSPTERAMSWQVAPSACAIGPAAGAYGPARVQLCQLRCVHWPRPSRAPRCSTASAARRTR